MAGLSGAHQRPWRFRGYVFVGTDQGSLEVFDISNPLAPKLIGGCNTARAFVSSPRMGVRGKHVCLTGWFGAGTNSATGFQVIDVSKPDRPNPIGWYETSDFQANGVTMAENYAYLAGVRITGPNAAVARLLVVDISDPVKPQLASACEWEGNAQDVTISGNYAYVSGNGGWSWPTGLGLAVIDLSDPAKPQLVVGVSGVYGRLAVSGRYECTLAGGRQFGTNRVTGLEYRYLRSSPAPTVGDECEGEAGTWWCPATMPSCGTVAGLVRTILPRGARRHEQPVHARTRGPIGWYGLSFGGVR